MGSHPAMKRLNEARAVLTNAVRCAAYLAVLPPRTAGLSASRGDAWVREALEELAVQQRRLVAQKAAENASRKKTEAENASRTAVEAQKAAENASRKKTQQHELGHQPGVLYAVGGYDRGALSSVERYDAAADEWTAVAPMGSERSRVGVAVVEGVLYAVGGSDGGSALSSVERYDAAADKWTAVAPMGSKRNGAGVASVVPAA
jgi:hypothetical protein